MRASILALTHVALASAAMEELWLPYQDETRNALLFVPNSLSNSSLAPVVINFHALASDPLAQVLLSDMNTIAEEEGFIVLYPRGQEGAQMWTPLPAPGPSYSLNAGKPNPTTHHPHPEPLI